MIIKKLLIVLIILNNLSFFVNCKLVYGDVVSFEKVLSPNLVNNNLTLPWGDDKIVYLSNPNGESKIPIVVGTNIPLGKEVSNDEDFMSIFSGRQYATMLAHFNCKKSDETCVQFTSPTPMFSTCLFVGSVDGFDHVRINSSLGGQRSNMLSWRTDSVGKFSNNLPKAGRIMSKNDTNEISLGCFEDSSKNNLNYILIHPIKPIDSISLCYKSFNEVSEYVLYGLVECADTSSVSFAISGYVFFDKLYSSSRIGNLPVTQTTVYIRLRRGGTIYSLDGKVITNTTTDERGFYYFDNLPGGDYLVFIYKPDPFNGYSPLTDPNLEDPFTNKANNGTIESSIYENRTGIAKVSNTNFDDIKLTSIYVLREMNIGILPANISLNGLVFIDYNGNGIRDIQITNTSAFDGPLAGVTAILYDGGRIVRQTVTDSDGNFQFPDVPVIPTGYIVKVITPDGYIMTNYPFPPAPLVGEPIELEIVPDYTLLVGLTSNKLYCQDSPQLAIICFANQGHNESHANDPVLITFSSNVTKHLYNMPEGTVQHVATHSQIGSVYGIGVDRNTGDIYTSAFMKYFSGFGPNGTGAIYKSTTENRIYNTELFFDLNKEMNQADYCGSDPHVYPMENFDEGVESVAKIAFGDLDIDDGIIYTIALATRELLTIPIASPSNFTLTPLFNPCNGDEPDWRPFALGRRHGELLIGGVCTQESNPVRPPVGFILDSRGNQVLKVPLDFPRGCKSYGGAFCIPGDYSPWSNVYFDSQPWISDITMDGEDMIISIRDRGGDLDRDIGTYDILRACYDGEQLILENGGVCGGVNGAHLLPSGFFGTPDGFSGGEYYDDNFFFNRDNTGHDNVASTAGVVIPGYHTLFGSSLDIDFVGQGTVKVWDNTNGNLLYGIGVYLQNNADPTNNFGKANGLGDMEPICKNYINTN